MATQRSSQDPDITAALESVFGSPTGRPTMDSQVSDALANVFGTGAVVTPKVEKPSIGGEFASGVGRGIESEKALFSGLGGTVASLVGADETASGAMQAYDRYMDEAEKTPAAVGRIEDIHSTGDFLHWLAGVAGEQVPIIASIIASGGLGALATRVGLKVGGKEVVEEVAKKYIGRGFAAGVGAASAGMGTGEVAGELHEAGLEAHPLVSLGGGALVGALDMFPIMGAVGTVAPNLAPKFIREFMKGFSGMGRAKKAALIGGLGAGTEGATEAMQELVVMATHKFVDNNFEVLGPEGKSRLLNAAAAGAVIGGGIGAAGGAFSGTREVVQAEDPGRPSDLEALRPGAESETPPSIGAPTSGATPEPSSQLPSTTSEVAKDWTEKERAARGLVDALGVPTYAEHENAERVESGLTTPEGLIVIPHEVDTDGKPVEFPAWTRSLFDRLDLPQPRAREVAVESEGLDAVEEVVEDADRTNLNEEEQRRLSRLVEKESQGVLKDKEYTVLNRLLEKATGTEAEAAKVVGWYAEDDRGTMYGPFKDEARALELTELFNPKATAGAFEVETLDEHGQLSTSGMVFQGREDAEALEEAIKSTRQARGSSQGRTQEQEIAWGHEVQNEVDRFIKAFPLAPRISLAGADSMSQSVTAVIDNSRGVFDPESGGVWLNPRNLKDIYQVRKTLVHEVFVHSGLRTFMNERERNALLRLVDESVSLDLLEAAGMDKMVAAEEYIARIAESKEDLGTWKKVVALIRRALRRVLPNLKLSDGELRLLVRDLGQAFRGPGFERKRYHRKTGLFASPVQGKGQGWWHTPGKGMTFTATPVGEDAVPVYVSGKIYREGDQVAARKVQHYATRKKLEVGEVLANKELMQKLGYDGQLTGRTLVVYKASSVRNQLNRRVWQSSEDGYGGVVDAPADNVHRVLQAVAEPTVDDYDVVKDIQKLSALWKTEAMKMFLTPQQIGTRVGLPSVQNYLRKVEEFWATKTRILNIAETVVKDWRNLGPDQAQRLSKTLFEVATESEAKGMRLSTATEQQIIQKNGLDEKSLAVYRAVNKAFADFLAPLERGMLSSAIKETAGVDVNQDFLNWVQKEGKVGEALANQLQQHPAMKGVEAGDALNLAMRIDQIREEVAHLRDRNYFPQMRFGKFLIAVINNKDKAVKEDGRTVQPGKLIHFETVENHRDQQQRKAELEKEFSQYRVQSGLLKDEEFAFLGFPPQLLEMLRRNKVLKLSEAQVEVMKEIFIRMSPGKRFMRSLQRRKGIGGYSQDAMRVFAAYMMNGANHLARVEHYQPLQEELRRMDRLSKLQEADLDTEGNEVPLDTDFNQGEGMAALRDYFNKHFEYLMSPGNDWAQLRALGFMWYLGFNPKSAFVNLTQIPMVTYPFLAARHGDARAVKALSGAYKDMFGLYKDKHPKIEVGLSEAIARGVNAGFLEESLATEIAAIAENPALMRMLPGDTGHSALNNVSYWGSFLFHHAEKLNRRVAFAAAWRLQMEKTGNVEGAYEAAKEAVQSTQYEYAKWNRAAFMRGKQSVLFLFWQYMQHSAFLAFGGKGAGTAVRLWMMLLMMAGMQGLPFAENAMDLFDFVAEKAKRTFGWKDPYSDVRTDIRELVQELGANPDMVMHGLSRYYGLGPMHALTALGAPIPNVDVSGSLSMGRVIPGMEQLAGRERDPDKRLARTMVEVGGPVAGMGYNFWRMMFEQHPDKWKPIERALPTAAKNLSQGIRYMFGDESVRLRTGAEIYDFGDMSSRAEATTSKIFKSLSFGPTDISKAYEKRGAQEEMRRYWLTRRSLVMQNLGYASVIGDREGVAAARQALARFNKSVPNRVLAITREDVKRSTRARHQGVALSELGIPRERRMRKLYAEVGRVY